MVTKVSLKVQVPAVGQMLNFLVPDSMKIANVIELIASIVSEEFEGIKVQTSSLMLVDVKNQAVLDREYSCLDFNIHNGSHLMLL